VFRVIFDLAAGFRLRVIVLQSWGNCPETLMSATLQRLTWGAETRIASERRPAKTSRNFDPRAAHGTDKIGGGACQIRLSVHGRAANTLHAAPLGKRRPNLAELNFMFLTKSLRTKAAGMACMLTLAAPMILAAFPATAKVLATVNGKQITDDDLKIAAEDLHGTLPPQLDEKARDSYLLDYLINTELVAQKAQAEKADQTPEFAKKLAYYKDKLLMEGVLTQVAKGAATDAAVKATYDEEMKKQKPETEIHARHILVGSEDEAKAVIKRLMAGEEFENLAKELSKDPGSEGGDLGWFTKDRMVPEFADAAFKLDVGQLSDPVKSPFGWHLIEVLDKREKTPPAFDQVKDQVTRYVVQKAQLAYVTDLRKNAKVEVTEPPAPPAAAKTDKPGAAASPAPAAPSPAPAPAKK
jgi:peptidyl-prolyl cis-trans isomerase C